MSGWGSPLGLPELLGPGVRAGQRAGWAIVSREAPRGGGTSKGFNQQGDYLLHTAIMLIRTKVSAMLDGILCVIK